MSNQKIKELEELLASGEIDEVATKEFRLAILNTKYNEEGKAVISLKEALEEQEWDEVFQQLLKKRECMKINFSIGASDWNLVSDSGYPEDGEGCHIVYQVGNGAYYHFVGAYSEEQKQFYVNFGYGGAVTDAENVIAWALFENDDYLTVNIGTDDEMREEYDFFPNARKNPYVQIEHKLEEKGKQ